MAVNWHWTVNHGRLAFHYWKELTSATASRVHPWPARKQRNFVSLRDDLRTGPSSCTYWLIHTLSMKLTKQRCIDMQDVASVKLTILTLLFSLSLSLLFQLRPSPHWDLVLVSLHVIAWFSHHNHTGNYNTKRRGVIQIVSNCEHMVYVFM